MSEKRLENIYSYLFLLGVYKSSIELFIPVLPQWATHFASILSTQVPSPESDCGLKIVVLQVFLHNTFLIA